MHRSCQTFGVAGPLSHALFCDRVLYCSYSKECESSSIQPKTPQTKQNMVSRWHWQELDWETALVWPHSRAFGDGLFELRPRGRTGIGRAFSCFMVGRRITVLHAFIKKTQQTPDRELKLARKRLKELQDG